MTIMKKRHLKKNKQKKQVYCFLQTLQRTSGACEISDGASAALPASDAVNTVWVCVCVCLCIIEECVCVSVFCVFISMGVYYEEALCLLIMTSWL